MRSEEFFEPSSINAPRIAAADYLHALPLLAGLATCGRAAVVHEPISHLAEALAMGQVDAAMVPAIDLGRMGGQVTVLPAGCVASSGGSLLARVFSQVPPAWVTTLWVDDESRTASALAEVLWMDNHHRHLKLVSCQRAGHDLPEEAEAVLVIGDRIVSDPPLGFDWQIDLGAMWYEMTGLPLVFAVWAAAEEADLRAIYRQLRDARRRGQESLEEIACLHAPGHGWPVDLARRFLTQELQFEFTDAHREGLEEYLDRAAECGIIDQAPRLRYYQP